MRPRKLYHQRIIVITQRGTSRVKQRNARCVVAAVAGKSGRKKEKERKREGSENLAIRAVRSAIIPRVVNVIVRVQNCEPCETVNRGVTRFGEAIHLCAIGYRSCFYLSDRKRPTRSRSRLSARLRSIRARLRLRSDRVNSINRSGAPLKRRSNFGSQKRENKAPKNSCWCDLSAIIFYVMYLDN